LYPLRAESIGALRFRRPYGTGNGLVRTERGVYELRMDLADKPQAMGNCSRSNTTISRRPAKSYIEVAKRLPEVQKVSCFAISRNAFTKKATSPSWKSRHRFVQIRRTALHFTYRVRFG